MTAVVTAAVVTLAWSVFATVKIGKVKIRWLRRVLLAVVTTAVTVTTFNVANVALYAHSGSVGAQETCEGRACPITAPDVSTAPGTPTTVPSGPTADDVLPDIRLADHPTRNYDLGCDEGAWDAAARKFTCAYTGMAFDAARSVTVIGIWVLHQTLTLAFDTVLAPVVQTVGVAIGDLADRLGVGYWAVVAAAMFGFLLWARGRVAAAFGEVAMSLLCLGLAAVIVGHLGSYYQGLIAGVRDVSLMAVMATDPNPQPAAGPEQALVGFDRALHQAFIEQPYMALNWGGTRAVAACQPAVDQILTEGPHGNSDRPRVLMSTFGTKVDPDRVDTRSADARKVDDVKRGLGWLAGGPAGTVAAAVSFLDRDGNTVPLDQVQGPCVAAARFNAQPTGDRLAGAVLTFLASLAVFMLLLRVALRYPLRGIRMAFGFILLPGALVLAAFPGDARDWAWRWIARIGRDAVNIVGAFVVVAVVIAVMRGLLAVTPATTTGIVLVRFGLAVLVAVAANVMLNRSLNKAGVALTRGVGRAAATAKPGSDRPAQIATFASGSVIGAVAAKHQELGRQIQSAKTIAGSVRTASTQVGHLAQAPGNAARGVWHAPARARSAVQAKAAPLTLAAGRAQQVWMQNPQLAQRVPAAGLLAQRARQRSTARVVAAGGQTQGTPRRPALYVETAAERRQLAGLADAEGGTMFPTRHARDAWERRTEWRVARLVGQERRPLVDGDFDSNINPDRRDWAIARSHIYHRHLTGQPNPPQTGPRPPQPARRAS